MTLAIGTQLGTYEIQSLLGAGGMGEVYKARDLKLDRLVAIKVLASHLVASDQALVRFRREAKAVAALSHPNILGIYDFGEHQGLAYAVTEYLEGRSLRDHLAEGPLPLRRSLDVARQMAEGLAAAHEKGIIHRDLKPDNVFILEDGTVKLLDFGLAKQVQAEPNSLATQMATQGVALTSPGMVMGTTRYMSPEQARGEETDPRSDLFSFGIVVWEMVVGSLPFKGETMLDTLQAILKSDPPELPESLQIPTALERLLRRCLNKRPEDRIQSAKDLAFHLEGMSTTSIGSTRSTLALPALAPRNARWKAILGLSVLVLAGGWGMYALGKRVPPVRPMTLKALVHEPGIIDTALFTPDGTRFVLGLRREDGTTAYYVQPVDGGARQRLQIPSGSMLYAISRNHDLVLAIPKGAVRVLATMPLDAQAEPREVMEHVMTADYNPQNGELSVISHVHDADPSQITCRVEHPVGQVRYTTRHLLSALTVAPDGQRVAFQEVDRNGTILIRLLEPSGTPRTLLSFPMREGQPLTSLVWSKDGTELLYTRSSRTHTDLMRINLKGKSQLVSRTLGDVRIHGTSRDGTLLVALRTEAAGLRGLLPGWKEEQEITDLPGQLINIVKEDVLLLETPAGEAMKFDPLGQRKTVLGKGIPLEMSADGKWVLSYNPEGLGFPLTLLPIGLGQSRQLSAKDVGLEGPRPQLVYAAFLPDGHRLLASGVRELGGPLQFVMVDLQRGQSAPWPLETPQTSGHFAISGDGKRVAFWPAQRSAPIHINDLETGKLLESVALPGDPESNRQPLGWSADGQALFLWKSGTDGAAIVRLDLKSRQESCVRTLNIPGGAASAWQGETASTTGAFYAYAYRRPASANLYLLTP